jgi:hypothetical protein
MMQSLELEKPVFLIGSRGTGKTTLLHSLNWRERLDNASLKSARAQKGIEDRCIGVYIRMPPFKMGTFEQWLSANPDVYGPLFSFFIDLISAELLADAIADLLARGIISASPSEEDDLLRNILEHYPNLLSQNEIRHRTLKAFASYLANIRKKLQWYSQIRPNPADLPDAFKIAGIGEFGRVISDMFAEFCDSFSPPSDFRWYFKVCMDEAEYLTPFQRLCVNSLMRLSQSALFHVVSYVRHPEDLARTLLPPLSLQKADSQIIILDTLSGSEFKEFVEGVASVRLQAKLKDANVRFSTARALGKLNINALLTNILNESENPLAKTLIHKADELFAVLQEKGITYHGSLPIYQAYLIEALSLDPDELVSDNRFIRRKIQSKQFRKKMVAAYLNVCRELNTKVRYAYDQMVLGMSDNCIRDYLAQIHEIFVETGLTTKEFAFANDIPIQIQNRALRRASEQKRYSLPKRVNTPDLTGRLVNGLAKVTAIVQSSSVALRSSELGLFVIDIPSITSTGIVDVIRQASEAGFLFIKRDDTHRLTFRVHSSLAAAFNFSYRGTYYECYLRPKELNALINSQDETGLEKIVKRISERISSEQRGQLTLF